MRSSVKLSHHWLEHNWSSLHLLSVACGTHSPHGMGWMGHVCGACLTISCSSRHYTMWKEREGIHSLLRRGLSRDQHFQVSYLKWRWKNETCTLGKTVDVNSVVSAWYKTLTSAINTQALFWNGVCSPIQDTTRSPSRDLSRLSLLIYCTCKPIVEAT